jgi:hypothetical protein
MAMMMARPRTLQFGPSPAVTISRQAKLRWYNYNNNNLVSVVWQRHGSGNAMAILPPLLNTLGQRRRLGAQVLKLCGKRTFSSF